MQTEPQEEIYAEAKQLIEKNRSRCLWFLRKDYYPADTDRLIHTLQYVKQHGDRQTFQKAGKLIQWLLQSSSRTSTG